MRRRPIDPVDTIWLNMDRPNNLMVIESLIMLATPADWDKVEDVLINRMANKFPVFLQRPVWPWLPIGTPHWEDDPDFSIDRHLRRVSLAPPGDDAALQDYINGHISRSLDRSKPLWEMHFIDGYGEGSAVYSRMHHALADGIALTEVLLSLTDRTPDAVPVERPTPPAEHTGLFAEAVHLLAATGAAALEIPKMLTPAHAVDAFTLSQHTGRIAGKLLTTQVPENPLSGKPGPRKVATWSQPIPLAVVKRAAHQTGTTVNDVLLSALAGAIASYIDAYGGTATDIPTMVPVNVRPAGQELPAELGNQFALVLVSLPSGSSTAFERLAETKRRMDTVKHSPEAILTFGMIQAIGRTGADMEKYLVDFFANRATGVTTNVPGPPEPRYLAGTRITSLLGWVPETGDQTLGVCIFSYDGTVQVGFKVDAACITDPEHLVTAFQDEITELVHMAQAG